METSQKTPHRLTVLLMAGFQLGMSINILLDHPGLGDPDQVVWYEYLLPWWVRGTAWGFCAAVAGVLAMTRWARMGYLFLAVMPVQRLVSHMASAWAYIVPGAPGGSVASFGSVLVWGSVFGLVLHLASRPERHDGGDPR